jgi:hypothetical protein
VFHTAVIDGVGTFLGPEAKKAFNSAFSLNTVEELHCLASEAGLKDRKVRFEHRTMRHPNAVEMIVGFMQSTPVASQFRALPEDKQKAFVSGVSERLGSYIDDEGLAAPLENHFLTASR